MTPIHLQKMNEYIGIDIKPCFNELNIFKAYIYSKIVYFSPKNIYVTERGFNKKSLDNYLYKIALKEGVNFEFSQPLTENSLKSMPENSIIATGSYSKLFKHLQLPYDTFIHFDSHMKIKDHKNFCIAYFDTFISGYGYGYIASFNNFASVEVDFFLNKPYEKYLKKFKKRIKETENLEFDNWSLVLDNIPKKLCLIKKIYGKTCILTGAIGGFHDPFFGFGVNSALISGKIAAITIISRNKGISEFKKFSKKINKMYLLSKIYNHLPLRNIIIPQFFKNTESIIPIIGKNLQNIPGFTNEDCFKIINIKKI